VINKPGNLPCHPGGRYFRNTLWHLLKTETTEKSFFFVNRIDRETSGIVLVAKTAAAAKNCQQQFQSGLVRKVYLVVVEGDFPSGLVCAEGFLLKDETSLIRKKQRFTPVDSGSGISGESRRCFTRFHLIDRRQGKSLVSAFPVTGRLHQIRATLSSLGYPVAGDKIYGVDETLFLRFIENRLTEEDRNRLCLRRQALHAESLELTHPVDGQRLHFKAEMPRDMSRIFYAVPFNSRGETPWNPRMSI
jgi:23S rRNA pseudouridine955/2504/2580 synthase/23S rRNA pseudouridine1911/1915/1917 synthase